MITRELIRERVLGTDPYFRDYLNYYIITKLKSHWIKYKNSSYTKPKLLTSI